MGKEFQTVCPVPNSEPLIYLFVRRHEELKACLFSQGVQEFFKDLEGDPSSKHGQRAKVCPTTVHQTATDSHVVGTNQGSQGA